MAQNKKRLYDAVWIDESGSFRVSGAISSTEEETIRIGKNHSSVKAGARLIPVDFYDVYQD